MKALIHGIEKNLIPYKGNPQKWWDGEDDNTIYDFSDLIFPTYTTYASETVLRMKVNVSASGTIAKHKKKSSSKKPNASKKLNASKV